MTVFLNGNTTVRCHVSLHTHTTIRDLIQECIEHFHLPMLGKYRLFDSQGGEVDNDDIEYLHADDALFLSKGEDFVKSSSLALYQEISVLGRGGFGMVKLYQHILTNKKVAIKFVNISQESASALNRIFKETETLRSLTHPNIVKLLDSFTLDRHLCFVMEYCKGGELRKYLEKNGPVPIDRFYSIALQIVEAIQYCHNARIIHRDLKLENILFADSMQTHLKIVDFGISGMLTVNGQGDRSDAGSLLYLAPEVLSGADNKSTPALDVWSIGCILYALLTGKQPFQGENQRESAKRILSVRYTELPPEVPPPLRLLIKGILRKDPSRRWSLFRIDEFLHRWRSETDFTALPPDSDEEIKRLEEEKELSKVAERKSVPGGGRDQKARRRATVAFESMGGDHKPKEALKQLQRANGGGKKAGTHRPV